MFRPILTAAVCGFIAGAMLASQARAALLVESNSGALKARADFLVSGVGANRKLTLTLSNSSANDVLLPADVLTAIFFKVVGIVPGAMVPLSATLGSQSSIHFEVPAFGGNDVGGEYAYAEGMHLFNGAVDRGVSTAGFGIFAPSGLFPGPDRNNQQAPNGLDYGIISAGDNLSTGNTPVTGRNPLIQNAVVFTFAVPATFEESNIVANSVVFQYGTNLNEPSHGPGVPEPALAGLFGLGWLALLRRVRAP